MEKSPPSGTPSSATQTPSSFSHPEAVERSLSDLLSTPRLSPIVKALGADADLHFVGGTVRDAFLNLASIDLDLATALRPDEALRRLNAAGIHSLEMGIRHGTLIAVIDGENIEITTFRARNEDGSIGFGNSIEEDLRLRDFTLNAIAFSFQTKRLTDPCHGVADLLHALIKTPGEPRERLSEDPLRILRMVRFGPAQGRSVDRRCLEAAKTLGPSLRAVSVERIRVELEKILLSDHPREAFRLIRDLGLLEFTIPEMLPSVGVEQNDFHYEDVFEHTLTVIERSPRERLLRWTALFHDLGKPGTLTIDEEDGKRHFYGHEKLGETMALGAMERLKFSKNDTKTIALIVLHHMRPTDCGAPGARRIMRDLGEEYGRWRTFKNADAPPILPEAEVNAKLAKFDALVESETKRLSGPVYGKLAVNGDDLIKLGIKPGKALGGILKQLEEIVLDDPEMNSHETLLAKAKDLIQVL